MNSSRILITGGAGFIGSHLAIRLAKLDAEVIVVDSINDYYSTSLKEYRLELLSDIKNIKFIRMNLENDAEIIELFRTGSFDLVYHLAAQAGVRLPADKSYKYVQSNLCGFMNLLLQVRNFQIPDFIYASSSSVYGNSLEAPFHENMRDLRPISLYGATKLSNEILAQATLAHTQTRSRGVRFFTVYGEMGRPDMAYFRILQSLIEDKPFPQFGRKDILRDFTYIGDAIDSLVLLASNLKTYTSGFGDVVNIGGGSPRTLSEMISILENLLGKRLKIEYRDSFATDVVQTIASKRYQEELIGYSPVTSLEEGLNHFYKWSKLPTVVRRLSQWSG